MSRREGAGRPKLDDPKANKVSMRLSDVQITLAEGRIPCAVAVMTER